VSRSKRAGGLIVGSAAAVAAVLTAGTGVAAADNAVPMPNGCPALVVLGIQGTSESSPTADPHASTGMLGDLFGPLAGDSADVQQILIPYPASFGGLPGTGPDDASFAASAEQASATVASTAAGVAARCQGSKIAVTGFSQGAGVAARFARRVGAGQGPVSPDKIAGVAVLSDWTRPPGDERFPGRPGQQSPDPVPGTSGAATSQVRLAPVPESGGIAADATDFGKLDGRVGEFCDPGDLACDAPHDADALTVAAGVAAQTDFRDPIRAVSSAGAAWSATVSATATRVLLDDVHVQGNHVDYVPQHTVSERLAQAAVSPDNPPTPQQTQAAAAVAGHVVAAVIADPIGQIPRLVGQIAAAVAPNIAANAAVLNPATLLRYSNVVAQHTAYGVQSPATQWLSAMTHDLTGGRR